MDEYKIELGEHPDETQKTVDSLKTSLFDKEPNPRKPQPKKRKPKKTGSQGGKKN